jgi:hypothetical protein
VRVFDFGNLVGPGHTRSGASQAWVEHRSGRVPTHRNTPSNGWFVSQFFAGRTCGRALGALPRAASFFSTQEFLQTLFRLEIGHGKNA